jgi:hypothetical protein
VCAQGPAVATAPATSTVAAEQVLAAPPCTLTTAPQLRIPLRDADMTPICDGVYAEPGAPANDVAELRHATESARQNLARAFGRAPRSSPVVLFCRTAECKSAFGADPGTAASSDLGFARDVVYTHDGPLERSVVVVTGPVTNTSGILTHELVHAEMKAWLSYDSLPTWFNEGMATFVANEPSCDAHPPSAKSSAEFDVTRLRTKAAWQRHIRPQGMTRKTYCEARHEVASWAARPGAAPEWSEALLRLMASVASGTPFDDAYAL